VTSEGGDVQKHFGRLDFVLDTVSAQHDVASLLMTLRMDGTLCLVGVPDKPLMVPAAPLTFGRRSLAGSGIGGIAETQEMLDFCAEHKIVSDVELVPATKINEALDRLSRADVRYRFVIDNSTL
jgi:uncharacterized zinc-type alcohol dehydrogenase-like protein